MDFTASVGKYVEELVINLDYPDLTLPPPSLARFALRPQA